MFTFYDFCHDVCYNIFKLWVIYMLGMQESLIFLVLFTFWIIRLYYKLYDNRTKFYVFIIGILIVFWMIIRITKGLVYSDGMARFCWYLYYVPLIFARIFICVFVL